MSEEQLRNILRSLPQVEAPADLENQLGRMIAAHSDHVPSLLGALPLVPAPDDFDAKLMEAIRERRRPVAPIPITITAGSASINWLNHIMGWMGGSLAVVVLTFFINHASTLQQESVKPAVNTVAPAAVAEPRPAAQPVPATTPAAPQRQASSAPRNIASSSPASAVESPAPAPVSSRPSAERSASPARVTVTRTAADPAALQQSEKAPSVQDRSVVQEKPAATTTDAKVDVQELSDPLSPSRSEGVDTNAEVGKDIDMPNGIVNTGGDRDGQTP
jgi:hypothetical protein